MGSLKKALSVPARKSSSDHDSSDSLSLQLQGITERENNDNGTRGNSDVPECSQGRPRINYGSVSSSVDMDSLEALECSTRKGIDIVNNSSLHEPPFKEEKRYGFDLAYVKRFYRLNSLLFPELISASSGMFLFLVCLVVLKEFVVYRVGLIASGYYKSLGDKDIHGFWIQTAKSMGLILAVSFVNSTTLYAQKVITAMFRKTLTETTHRLYFADIRFYQLNVLDKAIDNPDQRMAQDIDKFCTTYCGVLPKLLVSPFTIAYYCYQGYQRSGWQGPVGCFVFFLIATAINKVLMSPIVNFVWKQEKCEGDFRFVHMLVRVHSESLAFQEASVLEHGKVDDTLKKLVDTQYSLYLRQYFLSFAVNFVDYVGSIFSYLMLAIPIFSGQYDNVSPSDLSVLISQNAFILIYLIYTFTSIVDLSGQFTDVGGVTHRIAQLLERIYALEAYWKDLHRDANDNSICTDLEDWAERREQIRQKMELTPSSPNERQETSLQTPDSKKLVVWSLKNITFSAPRSNSPLISNLTLDLVVGESILITGPSSAGKTSVLRVLRGLWPYKKGTLRRHFPPGPHGVFFLPQRAYLTWGTLREQISFPLIPDPNRLDDELIMNYLERLKLMHILERTGGLDVSCSWTVFDSLSPGEMQRICLLRVFYHQPVVAVLDEVTSALPLEMEEYIYSELTRLGITLISIGHRDSIRKYHDKQLVLSSKGNWNLYPIVQ